MSVDPKKLLEDWFNSVSEEFNIENVYKLFNGMLRNQDEAILKAAGYKLVQSESVMSGKIEHSSGVIKIGDTYLKSEWSYYYLTGDRYDDILDQLKVVHPETTTVTNYY